MNLAEAGDKLIQAARRLLQRDVRSALGDGDYNMTVRRAQEAVELALKGALKVMGVDYPKVHDVGEVFAKHARQFASTVDEETLAAYVVALIEGLFAPLPATVEERRTARTEPAL